MTKLTFLVLSIAAAATVNATSLPFPGGALVIFFDAPSGSRCHPSDILTYPRQTVQYWYNGSELWQVRTDDNQVTIRRVPKPVYRGVSSIYAAAANIDAQDYDCTDWVVFDPKDGSETSAALEKIGINTGQLREKKGVWYWSQ